MKKHNSRIISIIVSMLYVFTCFDISVFAATSTLRTKGFEIADEVFLDALKAYDTDYDNVLRTDEIAIIEELTLDGLPIETLAGIENFTNLKHVSAVGCEINTLDGVRDMNLDYLNLSDNRISDTGSLSKLKAKVINLKNNKLKSITEDAPSYFEELYLEGNPLSPDSYEILAAEYLYPFKGIDIEFEVGDIYVPPYLDIYPDLGIAFYSGNSKIVSEENGVIYFNFPGKCIFEYYVHYVGRVFEVTVTGDVPDASKYKTEGFNIEDKELLKCLAVYDINNDYIISLDEVYGLKTIEIYNKPVRSLKGIEKINTLEKVSVFDCELESLDGIRDLTRLKELNVSGNNISQIGEMKTRVLESFDISDNEITDIKDFYRIIKLSPDEFYISGNPFYEEARKYYFYNIDTKLSIVGNAGDISWQKNGSGRLNVDKDSDFIEQRNDLHISNPVFTIEDTSVAQLAGNAYIILNLDGSRKIITEDSSEKWYAIAYDSIAVVSLLKEGHTRMRIQCDDLVKYTDIWVVDNDNSLNFKTEIAPLSDYGFVEMFSGYPVNESGIMLKESLDSITNLTIDGNKYKITDFATLGDLNNLTSLVIENYDSKMLSQIINLDKATNLKEIRFINCSIGDIFAVELPDEIEAVYVNDQLIVSGIKPYSQFTYFGNGVESQYSDYYTYENSFTGVIFSSSEKVFTPEDFPELNLSSVYTASKRYVQGLYFYTLIFVINEDANIESEMEKVLANSRIVAVDNNEYAKRNSYLELSESDILLEIGEEKDIYIEDFSIVSDYDVNMGLVINIDPEEFGSAITKDSLAEYGVDSLVTLSEAIDTWFTDLDTDLVNDNMYAVIDYSSEDTVSLVNELSSVKGIKEVSIYASQIYAEPLEISEVWSVEDTDIADIRLKGEYPIGKSAVISGLYPGTTTLNVVRTETNGSVSAKCNITVYKSGDVTIDNITNAEDALEILKFSAKLREFNYTERIPADVDKNNYINAEDALMVLKIAAKLTE